MVGIGRYVLPAAQPGGQLMGNRHPEEGHEGAEAQHADQGLAQHLAGAMEIIGADAVRHLHGKAGGGRHAEAAHEPEASGHQADGRPRRRAQMAHHGGVYVLHHHGGQLGQDGRIAEHEGQFDLLPRRKGRSGADVSQQYVFCSGHY